MQIRSREEQRTLARILSCMRSSGTLFEGTRASSAARRVGDPQWPMAYDAPCGGSGRYARPA
eukprot:68262-Prymnesium_polylepis.1